MRKKGEQNETWEKNKRVEKSGISTYPTRPRNRYSARYYQNDNPEYLKIG